MLIHRAERNPPLAAGRCRRYLGRMLDPPKEAARLDSIEPISPDSLFRGSPPVAPARPGFIRRFFRQAFRLLAIFLTVTIIWTLIYREVPPPITPLMVIRLFEGEGIAKDWVSYDEISPNLVRAVIAAEDSLYCSHWGFDFKAIREAWERNQNGSRLRGGSTISNQTAKNVFLWPGDYRATRYARKAIEPYFTLLIEYFWDKRRIIEVYLNVAEWGRGIYGAEAAAQYHFGKSAAELSRREAALLAAVLPSPRKSNAGKPSSYVRGQAGKIQARMNDIADPTGTPCPH